MKEVKVLKFWAPWCNPCSVVSSQLEGVELESYNIDEEEASAVAEKYNIRSIPTLIFAVGEENEEIHRHTGIINREFFDKTLDALVNDKTNPDYQDMQVNSPVEVKEDSSPK